MTSKERPILDESTDIRPLIQAQGFDCAAVWGESDDDAFPEEVMEDSDGDSYWAALAAWNPAKGEHEGWLIAAVMDTEDGPLAWLVRPKESGASDG